MEVLQADFAKYSDYLTNQKLEAEAHRKLNREMVRRRYSEQEVLDKYDKNGKLISRPAIVFLSTVGGGNQKVLYVYS
jgi:hypothetical protein